MWVQMSVKTIDVYYLQTEFIGIPDFTGFIFGDDAVFK